MCYNTVMTLIPRGKNYQSASKIANPHAFLHHLHHLAHHFDSSRMQHFDVSRLRKLVEIESPSDDQAAVNRAVTLVAGWCAKQGGRVRRHPQKAHGDLLEVWFGPEPKKGARFPKPLMLLGHLDTVWPIGTLAEMPFREEKGKLFGPGILDMKAGIVMALEALQVLPLQRPVVMLLNSDEEIGSEISRPLTEKIAAKCAAVFVLEPAQGLAYKTARKGVGDYRLDVTGIAAHSGIDFEKGHSAVLEMVQLVQKCALFCNFKRGITINPGVIHGGTRSNVIAAHAWAEIDARITKASQAATVDKKFHALKCKDPKCKLTVTGGINRPPMERSAGTVKLFKRAKKFAAELGFELEEAATGGGSDGNFTAAMGVPTLDGMGAVGAGAHAKHEHVVVKHLAQRTALLARMISAGVRD
jgi:glutamate carboxypeptidase